MNRKVSPTTSSFWPVIFAIFFGNFLASLSTTTINIALPAFMHQFTAELHTVQWMVTGFMLATGVIAPVLGYLGDQFSYKRIYILSIIGFTICSALCVLSWNIQSLISFRILQGLFSGLIMPATMTIIYQVVEKEKQAFALSMWSVSAMLGPALGPTVGGFLVQHFNWHALFIMNIPIGLIAIVVAIRYIPYYKLSSKQHFDSVGFVSVIISSGALLVALSQGSMWGWQSAKTLSLLIGGAVLLIFFILWELRVKEPLLHLRILRIRKFSYSLVLNGIISISLYSGTFLIPIYLQNVQHTTAMQAGLIMLPGSLMMVICAPIAGRLYSRIGPVKLSLFGVLLMVVSTWSLTGLTVTTSHMFITVWMAVRYIGITFANMPITNAGMGAVPANESGHASSINNWIKQGMGAFAIGIFSSLLASRTAFHLQGVVNPTEATQQFAFTWSVGDVFMIATIIIALAIPFTFMLKDRRLRPVKMAADSPL